MGSGNSRLSAHEGEAQVPHKIKTSLLGRIEEFRKRRNGESTLSKKKLLKDIEEIDVDSQSSRGIETEENNKVSTKETQPEPPKEEPVACVTTSEKLSRVVPMPNLKCEIANENDTNKGNVENVDPKQDKVVSVDERIEAEVKTEEEKVTEQMTEVKTEEVNKTEEMAEMKTEEAKKAEQMQEVKTEEAKKTEQILEVKTEEAKNTEQVQEVKTEEAKKAEQTPVVKTEEAKKTEQILEVKTEEAKNTEQVQEVKTEEAKKAEQTPVVKTEEAKKTEQILEVKTEEAKNTEQMQEVKTEEAKKTEQILEVKTEETKNTEQVQEVKTEEAKKAEHTPEVETEEAKKTEQIAEDKTEEAKKAEEMQEIKTEEAKKEEQVAEIKTEEGKKTEQVEESKKENEQEVREKSNANDGGDHENDEDDDDNEECGRLLCPGSPSFRIYCIEAEKRKDVEECQSPTIIVHQKSYSADSVETTKPTKSRSFDEVLEVVEIESGTKRKGNKKKFGAMKTLMKVKSCYHPMWTCAGYDRNIILAEKASK